MRNDDLITFTHSAIGRLKSEGRHGTAHVYQSTLNSIQSFERKKQLSFKAVTLIWLKAYERYLIRRGLRQNTISTYLRMLRSIYNQAVLQGIAPHVPKQFSQVYTGTRIGRSRALNASMIHRLMCPGRELPPELELTRCLFVLLFLLRGLCFVDLVFLRRQDLQGNTIYYRRQKTGRELTVGIEEEAINIIRHYQSNDLASPYLFPIVSDTEADGYSQYQSALRIFNRRLKQLSRFLKLDVNLTSYCARHSWATLANFRHYDKELI